MLLLLVVQPVRAAGPAASAARPATGQCDALIRTPLGAVVGAETRITSAAERALDGARYCVVTGSIDPAIGFEARLPVNGWSGRYLQLGCGGLCGLLTISVEHADFCVPVRDHQIVLASTDMGHQGMGGEWAARNPATRADFGYRGVHLTAVAVKALIRAYYGRLPRYSYFSGCSDGGREALIEAQRYPQDFDGIAAGAPALNFTVQNSFYHAWNAISNTGAQGKALLTATDLPLLHSAVLQQCDSLDGSRDGVIEDPRLCRFDPAALACPLGQEGRRCLSGEQVEAARRIYAGARDDAGRRLVMGGPMPGSELAWEGVFVPSKADGPIGSRMFVQGSVPSLYFEKSLGPDWTIDQLKFDAATLRSFKLRGLYDATNPDLAPFLARGGKLLLWHGWSDPHISPINSIGYYEAVARRAGRSQVTDFARLFLLPGIYRCGGGEGFTGFDVLTPLMDWVEHGRAPAMIEQRDAKTKTMRPTFPYPDASRRDAAGQWHRERGSWQRKPLDWLGADFFTSEYELSCDSGRPSQCLPGDRRN